MVIFDPHMLKKDAVSRDVSHRIQEMNARTPGRLHAALC